MRMSLFENPFILLQITLPPVEVNSKIKNVLHDFYRAVLHSCVVWILPKAVQ